MFERELSLIQSYIEDLESRPIFGSKSEAQRNSYMRFEAEAIIELLLTEEEHLSGYICDRMPKSALEILGDRSDEIASMRNAAGRSDARAIFDALASADETIEGILRGEIDGDEVYGCQDVFTGRYFKSNLSRIKAALDETNRVLREHGSVSLNTYYANLGIPMIKIGYNFEWEYPECREIKLDFNNAISENGMHCMYVDFQTYPKQNYEVWG